MEQLLIGKSQKQQGRSQENTSRDAHNEVDSVKFKKDSKLCLSSVEKDKRIRRKPDSIIRKLRIENPLPFDHVLSFLNIMGVNELALKNKNSDQSYYRSMFYLSSVEKVELRKNAVIIYLYPMKPTISQPEKLKIQYFIARLCSFGDMELYQLAMQMQSAYIKFQQIDFKEKLAHCFDSQPLSRFIQKMHDRTYMCKLASNKLVISRSLLQLLGEDMENYALELCKYKTPLREVISSESYTQVLTKTVEGVGSLCDFLAGKIDFQTLQEQSTFEFYDNLLTRNNKKIACKLRKTKPNPFMNCLQAVEISSNRNTSCSDNADKEINERLNLEMRDLRYRESESLRHLVKLQSNMLMENKLRVAGYAEIPTN